MNERNIILTGLPRAGTTLSCHLLNKLSDTVALCEPLDTRTLAEQAEPSLICEHISAFCDDARALVRDWGVAPSKQRAGKVPDNPVAADANGNYRRMDVSRGYLVFDEAKDDALTVCVKHPAFFTAVLERLVDAFPCFAIVRNPLSVLCSWNTVAAHVRHGHAPAAERMDGALAEKLAGIADRTDRQIHLLSWFFDKYETIMPKGHIVSYEDIVSTYGAALRVVTSQADGLDTSLTSRNRNPLYGRELMNILGERLLRSDGAFWDFYSKESVESLLCV